MRGHTILLSYLFSPVLYEMIIGICGYFESYKTNSPAPEHHPEECELVYTP